MPDADDVPALMQVTAQFCLWDHWRMLRDADSAKGTPQGGSAERLRRASHLAQLGASLISTLALPPTTLKVAPKQDAFSCPFHAFLTATVAGYVPMPSELLLQLRFCVAD